MSGRSPEPRRDPMSLGPNEALIGTAGFRSDLATPALLLDLDAFEANLRAMADAAARRGRKLRPHVKAHKCTEIGRRQMAAGAVGLCCATVREAEAMAGRGLDDLLLTGPALTPGTMARLAQVRRTIGNLTVVVDSDAGIDAIAQAATVERPIGVLIDLDMGQTRTGLTDPTEAVRLARRVAGTPQLHYRGVQAYYGHLQHVPALADRRVKLAEAWTRLGTFLAALGDAGLPAGIVSGGGTGTHHLDLTEGPFTEVQPGSYLFMDVQYGAVEIVPGRPAFQPSLTIAARVVSDVQPDRVILDAGLKAMATEAGPALVASAPFRNATHQFMGDEHSALRVVEGQLRPALGELVELLPPHCDPTVNLHDRLHVVRGDVLVDIWPIEARGY